MLDDLLLGLKKNAQKATLILSVSKAVHEKSRGQKKVVEKMAKEFLSATKEGIKNTSVPLGNSVKGKFGKKIKKKMETQNEELETF